MSVCVLSEGAGPSTQVPAHLTRIPIPQISSSTDCTDKTVKGKVIHKGPLVTGAPDDSVLKAVILEDDSQQKDSSPNSSINIILVGSLAKSFSQTVSQGDVVVASGFTVGKSPTINKDELHPCNLLLSGDDARVYVFQQQPPSDPRSPLASKKSSTQSAEVSKTTKAPKYKYVKLDDLKAGSVVNVFGVVVFFKQPSRCSGTDFCSSLKITDQSNQKIACTIFYKNIKDHPQIFKNGDIIRLHRVKCQSFNSSITLISTRGFSVVTFDGAAREAARGAVVTWTSSQSFHFDEEDQRKVEELRSWAAEQGLVGPVSDTVALSDVKPKIYFNLNCQLLSKAPIDSTCTLLRVWDGTRCPYTLLKVKPNTTEGPSSFSEAKESLIADVLVYDNHVESARQLEPGAFLRIYNLRSIPGSSKVPGLTQSQSVELDHLAFHLHGGTSYGRGICVLPENSPDVQELKRVIESFSEDVPDDVSDLYDSWMLGIWSTPPDYLDGDAVECTTERHCSHQMEPLTLSQLKQSHPGQFQHVRAQLRSYEPRRLHQALKLFCSKCSLIQDVPNDELVAGIFSEASQHSQAFSPPQGLVSGDITLPGGSVGVPARDLSIHLSTQLMSEGKTKQLLFLMGSTLEETCQLLADFQNIVPVTSSGGHLGLLDLSAPFLFRGQRRYYGCKRCSEVVVRDLTVEGVETIDEKVIAEALGVKLLQFVFLMKLELQDNTDTLDVFLWKDAELFFNVSADEASASDELQNRIRQTMDLLCPPEGSEGQRPWLNLCLMVYGAEDEGGQNQTCFQIFNTTVNAVLFR